MFKKFFLAQFLLLLLLKSVSAENIEKIKDISLKENYAKKNFINKKNNKNFKMRGKFKKKFKYYSKIKKNNFENKKTANY